MGKVITLLLLLLLAIASIGGYLYLTVKITAGNLKIEAGQKQLDEGEQLLARGKAKLASGKQRLDNAKRAYHGLNVIPFVGLAKKLPVTGQIFDEVAGNKISEGNKLIAQGNAKVKNGESQLAEGKQELQEGKQRLRHAEHIRDACAAGSVFFPLVFFILSFIWRKSVRKLSK